MITLADDEAGIQFDIIKGVNNKPFVKMFCLRIGCTFETTHKNGYTKKIAKKKIFEHMRNTELCKDLFGSCGACNDFSFLKNTQEGETS